MPNCKKCKYFKSMGYVLEDHFGYCDEEYSKYYKMIIVSTHPECPHFEEKTNQSSFGSVT
jgi:hypothetical protein